MKIEPGLDATQQSFAMLQQQVDDLRMELRDHIFWHSKRGEGTPLNLEEQAP